MKTQKIQPGQFLIGDFQIHFGRSLLVISDDGNLMQIRWFNVFVLGLTMDIVN